MTHHTKAIYPGYPDITKILSHNVKVRQNPSFISIEYKELTGCIVYRGVNPDELKRVFDNFAGLH